MSSQERTSKAFDLLAKAAFGLDLTPEEMDIITDANLEDPAATEGQTDYINVLLDKLGADLTCYTSTAIQFLTFDQATELIDELKDAVSTAGAWD
jgi:hypothetical protein